MNIKIEKLKNYIKQVRGISFNPNEIITEPQPGYYPILKANNITEDGLNDDNLIFINSDRINDVQFIKKGDILIAASSGSKKVIGKNVSFNSNYSGSFGAFCKVVRPINNIHYGYLQHFFKTPYYRNTIQRTVQGANINNLKTRDLDELDFPVPEKLEDQIRIANVLSRSEALIAKRKESIQLLDELLKSTFLDMFGDPVRNEKGWEKVKLNELGSIERGVSKHRPRNAPELLGGKYPLIQTGDVANSSTYITEFKNTYSEIGLKQSKLWNKGTLCITIAANIAKTGILTFNACFPDSVVGFKNFENSNIYYVHFLFSFFQRILEKNAPQAAQKNINLEILRNLYVPLPSLELQNQFAQIVEKAESIKTKYKESLQELENLYASLSQKAFKGELDLSKMEIEQERLDIAAEEGVGYKTKQ